MMQNLLIEIGNTALKAALSEGMTLGKTFRYQGEKKTEFILSLVEKEKPFAVVLASVYDIPAAEEKRLRKACPELLLLDPSHKDILQKYGMPEHLTFDRAAALIGARYLFKGKPCTVVDFGTTLTVDFMGAEGSWQGGFISLGCRTRFKALNRYSKALPMVNIPDETPAVGTSLQSSIEAGVISGIMFEIQGYIDSRPGNIVVFTGGDANYFAKRMKNSIFVVCNLVLIGLALITDDYVERKDS